MLENCSIELVTRGSTRYRVAHSAIAQLLASNQLELDDSVSLFVVAYSDSSIIGCAGLAGNIIKCVAVDKQWQGENLSAQLLTELQNIAAEQGKFHLFLYTKPSNCTLFEQNGFWAITQTDSVLLMENTPRGITHYCQQLGAEQQKGARIGAIVLNADPFTLGHRYLVEQARQQCDWLHLFVVQEEAATFSFADRLAMVQAGVADLSRLSVHAGGQYIISQATFPSYFLKSTDQIQQAWCELDLKIFREYIVPTLHITHRFVGSEPFCSVTQQYNRAMHLCLENSDSEYATLSVVEIARMTGKEGRPISASAVRRLLPQQLNAIRDAVPATTYRYIEKMLAK